MKKFLVLAFICSAMPAFAFESMPIIPASSMSPMHDMQTMQENKFRLEQIDYYNDVDTEKARFRKNSKTEAEQIQEVKTQMQDVQNQIQQAIDRKMKNMERSEIIREGGKRRIKYGE